MKLVWGRELKCSGFELHDWNYRWYGLELGRWGIGLALKKRVIVQTTEESSISLVAPKPPKS